MERGCQDGLRRVALGAATLALAIGLAAAAQAADPQAGKDGAAAGADATAGQRAAPEGQGAAPAPAEAPAALRAVRVKDSSGPFLDPAAPFWADAPAYAVAMEPQMIAVPMNPAPAIAQLTVKAVHNGQWMGFLIEWADPSRSDRVVVDRFGDQVAVEIPVAKGEAGPPSPTMGEPGGRVHIMQWRAAFQRDIDEGEPGVRDLYPNTQVDVYPDDVLRATDARPYMGAVGMDNPISHPKRSPVLDQMAEGFGTLTVEPDQDSDGRGVWADGRWKVVITHPLATGTAGDPQLVPGDETSAAFAVWEGGANEVGARKAWSSWVPLALDP